MTLPLPANAFQGVPDPIFDAIEAHKAARPAMYSAIDDRSAAEDEIMGSGTAVRNARAAGKADRLVVCESALSSAFENETEAACVLVTVTPTTLAGIIALLEYAIVADTDGEGWPIDLSDDDEGGRIRSWHFFLIERLAKALPGMVGVA